MAQPVSNAGRESSVHDGHAGTVTNLPEYSAADKSKPGPDWKSTLKNADRLPPEILLSMLDSLPANVMVTDLDGIIRYMNASSLKLLGTLQPYLPIEASEMIGQSLDVFHQTPEHPRRLLTDDSALPHAALIKIGPETLRLLMTAIYDREKRYANAMLTWEVVTEKLRLEAANADFAAQIAAIGNSQAVIEFKMDGTVISANGHFLKSVGYRMEEVEGRHHGMFVDAGQRQSAEYKEFWAKLNRGETQMMECRRIGKGGKEVWLQASYTPILDAAGKPRKVVKYASDITTQKLALHAMMADVSMLLSKAVGGQLKARADASQHQDEYRKLVQAINDMLDAILLPIEDANRVLVEISQGKIDE